MTNVYHVLPSNGLIKRSIWTAKAALCLQVN
jgi:hypothetical protein